MELRMRCVPRATALLLLILSSCIRSDGAATSFSVLKNLFGGRSSSANGLGTANSTQPAIARCITEAYVSKVMNWDAAMMGSLPAVKAVGSWLTSKISASPLTIVTQATLGRMPQLEAQCKAWKGPLSVVLYKPIYQPESTDGKGAFLPDIAKELKEDLATISAFGSALDARDYCHLSVLLVVEVFADRRALLLYPMNLLRNLARLQARTPMVAMLDVDILPSADLTNTLMSPDSPVARRCLAVTAGKGVVVLPTFETNATGEISQKISENAELADLLSQQDKAMFKKSVDKGLASPFDGVRYPNGHNWTLFDKWYISTELYQIEYGNGFEPFVIIDRKNAPWHDVRYRGYGWNKIVHLSLLNFTGFQFHVHPTAFVVHRAHIHSSVSNAFFESYSIPYHILSVVGKQHDGLKIRIHNQKLFDRSKVEMAANEFNVALDAATRHCMAALPWFQLPVPPRLYTRHLATQHSDSHRHGQ